MTFEIIFGVILPFIGTLLGAGCVIFTKGNISPKVHCSLLGFSGGIMVAASIWSLILPAIDSASWLGRLSFLPAVIGFLSGCFFLLLVEWGVPLLKKKLYSNKNNNKIKSTTMLVFAVGLHNIPEGMAVGAVFAGLLASGTGITLTEAICLSIGIAIQNIPEGAIISLPLRAEGRSRTAALAAGIVSGIVEPIGAALTLLAVGYILPILPFLLGFAAGAMIYVVISELVPKMSESGVMWLGEIMFSIGFSVMMILDVVFGG